MDDTIQRRVPLLIGLLISAAMIIAIASGIVAGGFVDGLGDILGDPWGRVTMIDLAAGLVLIGAWIRFREGSVRRAAPWWLALVLTGNLAAGIYVALAAYRSSTTAAMLLGQHPSR